jgi:hypothetical protein
MVYRAILRFDIGFLSSTSAKIALLSAVRVANILLNVMSAPKFSIFMILSFWSDYET